MSDDMPAIDDSPQVRWEKCLRYMAKLVEMKAPDCIKAHYVVHCLIPRLCQMVGIDAMSYEFSRMFARQLSIASGTCLQCHKKPQVIGDDFCVKCLADYDQFVADIEKS